MKSLRQRQVDLQGSFARVEEDEVFLYNMHIRHYDPASQFNVEPMRRRKLLLQRKEIDRLIGFTVQRGRTLIPLRCYFSHGLAKIELGVAKGKRRYDKREAIHRKVARREIERAITRTHKGTN